MIYIALGGMTGALARYGLSRLVQLSVNEIFPWGTLFVNLSGSLAIGVFFEFFDRAMIPSDLRSFIAIGFLGAYTTFSSYSLETINLLREGEIRLCLTNVLLNNILGLLLVVLGMYVAKLALKTF
ncbi:TPA: fluoride efflux transporter CrcB [Candidatus Edwardsbacteria bacterium]|nr:fluoride efflux transporter CrcB [Candidatus Edwardsbacteria bacterium]HBZ86371.1 fluoride efflux transporter CrcB [Candidatus Edwardsbacteria bacterium]